MADNTISTSRQSCEPDCNQLTIDDQSIMNKYSEIKESPTADTEEQSLQGTSATMKLPVNLTKMIQNKLKRKKKLSTSLTSVSETVDQEKRTRIEGIQLNCRGKLNEDLIAAATSATLSTTSTQQQQSVVKLERVQARATLPSPKVAEKIILLQQQSHHQQPTAQHKTHQQLQHPQQQHQQQQLQLQQQQQQPQLAKVPPPRLKRKLEENVTTIQKLSAQTDQMRMEIAELKSHLSTEKSAVRVLRAQNESETRKWKTEIKKLHTAMELMRKVKKSKEEACANWAGNSTTCSTTNCAKDANITNHELQRLTNEITTLREANKNLEEKLQISNDAERRKAADLRELKDSYEIRLTQLSKSAKTEISRLLEEIKTKERNIGQLKNETQTLQKLKTNKTTNHNKKDTHTRSAAQHPSEMKKLKDIERNKNNINNNCNVTNKNTNNEKCFIKTTCGEKEFHSMPHEITERILEAHNDVHAYGSKQDHQNSDSDSALSSAPPSISPQPPPTGMEPADIWQTIRNYTKDIEKVQNDLESIQKENQALQKELNLAKQQILESEKTAGLEATNNAKMQQKMQDRIKYLEQRENELQDETHELREQNELLEFRILELEESNDKWSLQSNTTPNNKNVWNDSGKETDDTIIFTDRSDSGVTSPHSHHHIDDRINVISPCDLHMLDHMTTDDLRRRLSQMIKKPNIEEDDKMCLQQVLAFMQNLDVMSHDSLPSSEESSSLEYIKSRVSDYGLSPTSSDLSPTLIVQKPKLAPPTGRIVATVLPYSNTVSPPNDSPQRKLRAWNTSSLTESGVFEGDLSESSVYTQTYPEDFAYLETTGNKDLCIDVHRLIRFGDKFEDCATKSSNSKVPVPSLPILSHNLSDQKRIQYYKDRLDVLESKLLIYESSGDLQAKRLADRLQREIQLENLVKELRDRVDFLEVENSQLEEEKCEFEEAENDTRLRLQRLEVELEILSQRNIELEMSREALQNKLKDCRSESVILRDDLAACQTQVCHLEEDRCRYKENFEFLHSTLPALVLFNVFFVTSVSMGNTMDGDARPTEQPRCEPELPQPAVVSRSSCDYSMTEEGFKRESQNLREEIRSLKRQIGDLNSRHTEALACADGYWEDLERNYNEQLLASKTKEDCLKQKIKQLEGCLQEDSKAANEKICQLEDAERELKMCLQKVSRDHREILKDHDHITEEYRRLKEKYDRLKEQVDGPIKEAMERERSQAKNLKDELGYMRRLSCEQEMHYRNELDCFQAQLEKLNKELMQIQVTNSELKEEVCTLEKEVILLHDSKKGDLDKIRVLTDEVRTKDDMCMMLEKRVEALLSAPYYNIHRNSRLSNTKASSNYCSTAPSLAQELNNGQGNGNCNQNVNGSVRPGNSSGNPSTCNSPTKRFKMEEPKDLVTATKHLGTVLSTIKVSKTEIPSHKQFENVANDVKKLAETILAGQQKGQVSAMADCCPQPPSVVPTPQCSPRRNIGAVQAEKPFDETDMNRVCPDFPRKISPRPESRLIMYGMAQYDVPKDVPLVVDPDKDEKNPISEVPSELRKITSNQKNKNPLRVPRRVLQKRFSQSLRAEIRKVISSLKIKTEKASESSESDDDRDFSSEVFERKQSLASFHSIEDLDDDVFLEPVNDMECSTQTDTWSDKAAAAAEVPTGTKKLSKPDKPEMKTNEGTQTEPPQPPPPPPPQKAQPSPIPELDFELDLTQFESTIDLTELESDTNRRLSAKHQSPARLAYLTKREYTPRHRSPTKKPTAQRDYLSKLGSIKKSTSPLPRKSFSPPPRKSSSPPPKKSPIKTVKIKHSAGEKPENKNSFSTKELENPRAFISRLFVSARDSAIETDNVVKIEMYLRQRYRHDENFRKNLDLMTKITYSGTEDELDECCILKSITYDDIVKAMQCLAYISEIYHPFEIPVSI